MRLDVLLRQGKTVAITGDADEARSALGNVTASWSSISTQPPIRGSPDAWVFHEQLAAVQRALAADDLKQTGRNAVKALVGADGLERLYESGGHDRR
jgi:hypothetical protein